METAPRTLGHRKTWQQLWDDYAATILKDQLGLVPGSREWTQHRQTFLEGVYCGYSRTTVLIAAAPEVSGELCDQVILPITKGFMTEFEEIMEDINLQITIHNIRSMDSH